LNAIPFILLIFLQAEMLWNRALNSNSKTICNALGTLMNFDLAAVTALSLTVQVPLKNAMMPIFQ